jgi:RHS repeat-associated protein
VRTNYAGSAAALYASFAYGDDSYAFDILNASSGYNQDNAFYAGLDYDSGSETDHAMFRQYTPLQGRWMGPDPYMGSYDQANPQSFNRYSYAMNNPVALTDPSGLDGDTPIAIGGCVGAVASGGADIFDDIGCGWSLFNLFGLFGSGPSFHGTLSPRPSTGNGSWDGNFGESLGIPTSIPQGSLGAALGLPSQGCEFGPCGAGSSSLTPGQGGALGGPILITPPTWAIGLLARFFTVPGPLSDYPLNGNLWPGFQPQDGVCTTGPFAGPMNNDPAILKCCQAHDNCYTTFHCNASSWLPGNPIPGACSSVCNAGVVSCIGSAK